ncbi:hypothetical protein LTR53_013876 [Teratosphaeriaceae sp. CCFEE 6253]|nr:hypothetical protein LTR53_013876 [Teratosphaeriaceae sp. CCFEE 6253]
MEIDVEHQIAEVRQGSPAARTAFLGALCTNAGIDLNERSSKHTTTYIRSAAKHGNLEVVAALADSGASQYVHTNTYLQEKFGPVDELLERWYALRQGIPEYVGKPDDEIWVLPHLLLNASFDGADVLFKAIETLQPTEIFRFLLDAGCGVRDGAAPVTWKQKTYGSEVIEAVKCNISVLELMMHYGLALEREDRMGYTALLHALDRGMIDSIQVLIEAEVNLTRRTASGHTPLEFARRNLTRRHPRAPRQSWTVGKGHPSLNPVSIATDQAAYDKLLRATFGHDGSNGAFAAQTQRTPFPDLPLPRELWQSMSAMSPSLRWPVSWSGYSPARKNIGKL